MKQNNQGIITGTILGTAVAVASCLLFTAIFSWLVIEGHVKEKSITIGIYMILFLSSLLGVLIAARRLKEKRLVIAIAVSVLYILVLFTLNIVFYDGSFKAVGTNLLTVVIGMAVGCLPIARKKGRKRIKEYRHR